MERSGGWDAGIYSLRDRRVRGLGIVVLHMKRNGLATSNACR